MINPFKRYPYIVVEGPIGSGKSTLSRMLSENFGSNFIKEKADQNPFLPKFYKNMAQYALPTQLFFLFRLCFVVSAWDRPFKGGVVIIAGHTIAIGFQR